MYMMECENKPWNVEKWSQQVLNGKWIPFFQLLPETVILKLGYAYPLVYAKVLQGVHE